jgi:hypothetical protein
MAVDSAIAPEDQRCVNLYAGRKFRLQINACAPEFLDSVVGCIRIAQNEDVHGYPPWAC